MQKKLIRNYFNVSIVEKEEKENNIDGDNMSEEKGINASEIDPLARTPQQMKNLREKIESQTPKIKFLKEITKEYEHLAKVKLDDKLPPKEKVRNRAEFIQERRKIADFHGISRRYYPS